ncbi:MAG: hypothetical protein QXG00_05640 [Candidatus Woesearchaeota archaeon]
MKENLTELEKIVEKNYLPINDFIRDYEYFMRILMDVKLEKIDRAIDSIISIENKSCRVIELFSNYGDKTYLDKKSIYYEKLRDIFNFRQTMNLVLFELSKNITSNFELNYKKIKNASKLDDFGLIKQLRHELNLNLLYYTQLKEGLINKKLSMSIGSDLLDRYSEKVEEFSLLQGEIENIKNQFVNTSWSEQNINLLRTLHKEVNSEKNNTLLNQCRVAEYYEGVFACNELSKDIGNSIKYLSNQNAGVILSKLELDEKRINELTNRIYEAKRKIIGRIFKMGLIGLSAILLLGYSGLIIANYIETSDLRRQEKIKEIKKEREYILKELDEKKCALVSLDSALNARKANISNFDKNFLVYSNQNKFKMMNNSHINDIRSSNNIKNTIIQTNTNKITNTNKTINTNKKSSVSDLYRFKKLNQAADFIIYVNKENNTTSVINIRDNVEKLVYSCLSSDGVNQGNKVKQGDHRTPEGIFSIASVIDYRTDSLFGVGKIRINTGYYGIVFCGADYSDRIKAIDEKIDCTNGGVIVKNDDFLKILDIINGHYYRTLFVIESPSNNKIF